MIRTERYKYAIDESGTGYMLYDLSDDPLEQCNLIGHSRTETVQNELERAILRFLLKSQ